ncbi:hypothetical protein C8J56DRAFT_903251 [Mycena floridula]|nr:hypothetical protein C8J56DRAFT_903251 [Mycena floridula]
MEASADSSQGSPSIFYIWTVDQDLGAGDMEDVFSLEIHIFTQMWHYNIPPQLYPILRQIHEACGFNPDSTEIAEYMGYLLLKFSEDYVFWKLVFIKQYTIIHQHI